jgi:ApbE superfamily uncharacterized protein (UPF0280 family)
VTLPDNETLAKLMADAQTCLEDISMPRDQHDVMSGMADAICALRKRVEAADAMAASIAAVNTHGKAKATWFKVCTSLAAYRATVTT